LRQTFTLVDDQAGDANLYDFAEDVDNGLPAESKSSIGRSASTGRRKKVPSSRLSFGVGDILSGDAAEALEDNESFMLKKATIARRVIESNALRKSLPAFQIPLRGGEDDNERPTYSKNYLNELRNSTPTTPKDLRDPNAIVGDVEDFDESELEGATIVDSGHELGPQSTPVIPTEAEIREKKERRARLAHEQDFISLNDDSGDDRRQVSLLPRKKKTESRLVREDEDLGEGFDEFVDDGRISLGKKAEREAKKQQRAAMADMINEAEGSASDTTDDSEAERRAAYEATQTRAGMDGLSKPNLTSALPLIPPKITSLPSLSECLQRLQTTLSGMEHELARQTKKMAELQQEKAEIITREEEVQRLLKEAGDRYAAMRADSGFPAVTTDPKALAEGRNGLVNPVMADRGLESFGNTPVGHFYVEDGA
jgi:Nineteen complex-related protein 2